MANVFKRLTGNPTRRAKKKGNLARGIGGDNYGPTSQTGYYSGVDAPNNGYVVTTLNASNLPEYRVANDLEGLVLIANDLGGNVFHGLDAKTYLLNRTNTWIINSTPKNQTTDGLVIDLDASDVSSYTDNQPTVNTARTDSWMSIWNNSGTAIWNDNDQMVPRLHPDVPVISMEKTSNGNSHLGIGYTTGVVEGKTYTYSMYIWIPETNSAGMSGSVPYMRPFPANYGEVTLSYNGSTAWGSWPRNQWIKIEGTGTPNTFNGNGVSTAYISSYLNTKGDKVYYTCPQFEETNSATAFVKGTRTPISTWYDLSGKNNNSTLSNTPTYNTGGYLTFDGVNDFATINSNSSFNVNAKTVEITFKMEGTVTNFAPLAIYANGSSSINRIWLGIQNSKFQMHGWGTDDPTATTTLAADTWYTCVFSYDKSTQQMKMYTNGVLEKTQTNNQSGVTATEGMNWYLAHVPGGWQGQTYANVSIKSFKVYDRILSDNEVANNYHKGGIITDGLVTAFDPGELTSFSPSGETTTYSLVGNNTGTLYNGVEWSYDNGGTFDFDGTNDHIQLSSPLNLKNSSFSLEAWVKWDGGSTDTFFGYYDTASSGTQRSIHWRIYDSGLLRFDFYSNSINSAGGAITPNTWYHLLATYDYASDTCKCYRNGNLLMQGSAGPYIGTDSTSIGYLGAWTPSSQPFGGNISIFRHYNRALTPDEVLQNYNEHRARYGN